MNAISHGLQDPEAVSASRIEAMLQEVASLVSCDPDAARLRLDQVIGLFERLPKPDPESNALRILAPWQARRVEDYVERHLDQPIRIQDLAEHTRLSVSYFFRAFRGTFGTAPHAFVMRQRIDRAMRLLIGGDEPIAQIAIACGFADQAHLSRTFARQVGSPPGVWRRLQRGGISLVAT